MRTKPFFKHFLIILTLCSITLEGVIQAESQRRIYVDMVADLFHFGHVEYLKKVKNLGGIVIVGIHSDATVESYKRRPIMTMEERIRSVKECCYVDEVIPDAPLQITLDWIRQHEIDLIIHGDDISAENIESFYGIPQKLGIFMLVPYTPGISTTEIIRRVKERENL